MKPAESTLGSAVRAPLYVVGVGASAGGLEALEQLFSDMPPDTGLAFVVVQHLSPDFRSVMDELLARRTRLPVLLVEDGVRVEANHIYLIPPKKEMIISSGRLLLSDKGKSLELTMPIDIFFRSLAQDAGPHAIAIVLSGGGSDGSRGSRDIHDAGGLVIAQNEASAAFDSMPRSARDTGVVDHVAPPREMPRLLLEHVHRMESASLGPTGPLSPSPPHGIGAVFTRLQDEYGIDFSYYKPNTVLRRIERRLTIVRAADIEEYVARLSADREELDALYRDLLIGVTRFFRDEDAFDYLETSVIPELVRATPAGDELRVWVPGCATGEEAYSIAILLHEAMERIRERARFKIFATDVHGGSLEFASRGLYSQDSIASLRPDRLARYFTKEGPNGQIVPELRQLVVFARHNVLRDAPFTRVDLVSCRNLLIYFRPVAQKKVLSLLHFALKRNGILFLGPSESQGSIAEDFETLNAHWRIYRKRRDRRVLDTRIPMPRAPELRAVHGASSGVAAHYSLVQALGIYDALLDEYMPPSLLVNERRELVHAFGGAGRFIKVRDGRPSLDLLDMVEPDLKMALTGALQRALKERAPVVYTGLRLRLDGEDRVYKLTVKPVAAKDGLSMHLLVTLEHADDIPARLATAETALDLKDVSHEQLGALEAELRYTKENLHATIEELETSNEELQATNEEMLASNEELQSTNEELQSVNEELYTVNAEYQKKITQLTELTHDVDNLLLATEVGTIFLDRQLCIRKFTPRLAEAFNLLPQDIGRPIAGFSSTLEHPTLMDDLTSVLKTEKPIEREVRGKQDSWHFLRIFPYRAKGTTEGVVVTLIDINGLKRAEDALFRERYLLDSLMENVPDAIYFKDVSGRFVRVNHAMAARLGLKQPDEAEGKRAADFLPQELARAWDEPDEEVLRGEHQPYRREQCRSLDGRVVWLMATRYPLRDRDGKIVGMCGVARDVTEQKHAEDEIRSAVVRRDQFLAMLSHELRNPLGAIVCASKLLTHAASASSRPRGIEVIERQSNHMARLLDDLLEISRITQNKIKLDKRIVDARSIVEEAIGALEQSFRDRDIELATDFHPEPVLLDADPARLQQVVVNLLGNAAKYTDRRGHVWVRVTRSGAEAEIIVRDDGAGIDSAMLPGIFDMFVQGDATLARTEGGMGVGLTLVRALVEMHGGTVHAESAGTTMGSTFTIRIPTARTAVAIPAPARRGVAWRLGNRVALIDDNKDGCLMLEEVFRLAGYEVFCAHDGESGLELIDRVQPDIAFVDIGLPRMNGYELARILRAKKGNEGLYMIALTGYGQPNDRAAAFDAGFDEHVVKPLHPDDLEQLLLNRPGQRPSGSGPAHRVETTATPSS